MNQPFRNLPSSRASALRTIGKISLVAVGSLGAWPRRLARSRPTSRSTFSSTPRRPPPRHEVVVERDRPGPDYIWVAGYWGGAPGHYSWVAGHWDRPPHGHGHWVAPRWENHNGHYVQVKGEWRD